MFERFYIDSDCDLQMILISRFIFKLLIKTTRLRTTHSQMVSKRNIGHSPFRRKTQFNFMRMKEKSRTGWKKYIFPIHFYECFVKTHLLKLYFPNNVWIIFNISEELPLHYDVRTNVLPRQEPCIPLRAYVENCFINKILGQKSSLNFI